jgi:hypothetical protein
MEMPNKYEPYIRAWIDELAKLPAGEIIRKSRDDFSRYITQDMGRTAIGFNKCFLAGEMPFHAKLEKPHTYTICIERLKKFDESIYKGRNTFRDRYVIPIRGQRERMKKMLAEKGIIF